MKLFNWMHSKLNGSKAKNKLNSSSSTLFVADEASKDEFSDWPRAILAIGTFGNNNLKDDSERIVAEDLSCSHDCVQELTLDEQEGDNFQNELKMCFREESSADHTNTCSNCEKKETLLPNGSLIPCRGKDLCLDNNNNNNNKSAIGNKSLTFLLKKMFVCRSGLHPTPSFKDPLSTESRMEKILRAILNKKIYPQGPSSTMVKKKYLKDKQIAKSDNDEDEFNTVADDGNKWVKTDSEYIVLEI
ncbi:uncharacterized protein LOC114738858 [Neltuma alba]|uniref:uncharacterized protein LOC114738858 n=1 Tax=Neltuma alba TaxID=207710 RepID=UPI0010A3A12D|nr:uncharacterized protein LOC114738858 [Prosopis alba]